MAVLVSGRDELTMFCQGSCDNRGVSRVLGGYYRCV